ncbi:uncharacterized protein LOC112499985 [Cynara cardunculus var. scolymus]|uniref:uncharacterized protein LOC112499985 n=1 Tax=Cynara cardunculus var. scolymus TaxID=59895 RepID=UPI000D6315ED|nr:uncharacterized protein LOC112499985 [Cynara cardunculus var. scolymus]
MEQHIFEIYDDYSTFSTLKIYHGGVFIICPSREYINGKYHFVDLVDSEEYLIQKFRVLMKEIGIRNDASTVYHFKIPRKDLNFVLEALGNNLDVLNLLKYAPQCKIIEVYTEVIKELPIELSPELNQRVLLEWVDKNQEVDCFDLFDDFNPFDETMEYQNNEVNEESDSDGFVHDDRNVLDDGVINNEVNVDHELELEDFESNTNQSNLEVKRFTYLKKLNKKKGSNIGFDKSVNFYPSQVIGSKEGIKKMVDQHAIETRREIVVVKNNLHRMRAVC